MKKIIYSIPPTVVPKINLNEKKTNNFTSILKKIILKIHYHKVEKFYHKILKKADQIITSNDHEFNKLKKKFKNKILYLTMPHEDDFYFKKIKINTDDKIVVVHAGHLKNSLTKISLRWIGQMIIPLIIKLNLTRNFLFLILGKYKPDNEIKKLFINVKTKFLGHISNEKYKQILYNADAYVFAAKYRTNGFINRIISALSIPTSIVTTNELVQDFKILKNNIHLLSNNNPIKFLNNIIKLKNNKKLSKKLRKNARNIYKKEFTPKVFEEKIYKFFINNKIL
jgi:glycosyltransferase involved in cell wall biosynthesis